MFAIVIDNAIAEYPILDIYRRFPQTSFPEPMVDSALPDGVVRVFPSPIPAYDQNTHQVQEGTPEFMDGKWYATYVVTPLSESELSERAAAAASLVRATRAQRLQQSDWTQLADTPVNKAAWASYRQALRDVPAQAGFPHAVVWPQEP
jgi:hypothetical protein